MHISYFVYYTIWSSWSVLKSRSKSTNLAAQHASPFKKSVILKHQVIRNQFRAIASTQPPICKYSSCIYPLNMAHIKTKIYAVDLLRRFDRFYGCWLNINIYSERTERGAHASVSEYYSNGTVPHSHLRWNCLSNYCLLGNKKWNVSLIVVLTVLISSQDKNCILYFTK